MGRPRLKITAEQVYALAEIGATYEEMGSILKCAKSYLVRNHKDTINEAYSNMRTNVRRTQMKVAGEGNVSMLIHLGKTMLKQHDVKEITVDGQIDNKIQIEFLPSQIITQNIIEGEIVQALESDDE